MKVFVWHRLQKISRTKTFLRTRALLVSKICKIVILYTGVHKRGATMYRPLGKFVKIPVYKSQLPLLWVYLIQVANCICKLPAQHHFSRPFLHCLPVDQSQNSLLNEKEWLELIIDMKMDSLKSSSATNQESLLLGLMVYIDIRNHSMINKIHL